MIYNRPIVAVRVYPSTFMMALRGLLYIVLTVLTMAGACALTTALKEVL